MRLHAEQLRRPAEERTGGRDGPRPAVPPPVTADQITPANAHEKEQALGSEIDRDMRQAQDAAEPKK